MAGKPQKRDRYGLTANHRVFADAYLISRCAVSAAEAAGYSKKSCEQQGSMLLKLPEVTAYIQKRMDERSERTNITADDVLRSIKDIRDTCREQEKFPEALKANEMLGKHLRLFAEVHEHKGSDDLADKIAQAFARSSKA